MAEEKQLTVAELLARARQENPDEAKAPSNPAPKRRRRRNLEDGGVSVAELTGSFRAVQAAPAEAKHSSVPMDEPEEPGQAPKTTEAPEAEKAKAPEAPAEPKKAEKAEKPETAAEPKKAEKPAAPAQPKKAEAPAKAEKLETPAQPKKAEKPETPAEPKKAEKPETPAEPKKAEKSAEAAVGKPGETGKTDKSAVPSPSSEDTGVISKVSAEPKTAAKSETESETAPESTEETADKKAEEKGGEKPAETTHTDTWEAGSAEDTDTWEAGSAEDADTAEAEQFSDDEEPGRTSAGTVILLALVGVVVGVLIFLGFQFLWGQFNLWLVAVLAIVVTVAMIFGVRAMRTASDGLSMTLAGLVGIVVTFGPAALVLL